MEVGLRQPACSRTGELFPSGRRCLVMGILNVTPDSFSDGGRFFDRGQAVDHALAMEQAGADIIDIGGESTRPGSASVSASEQKQRVLPVLESLRAQSSALVSIDTTSAAVAAAALDAGADLVNDTSALRDDPAMASLAALRGVPVVLMHRQGRPRTMQRAPHYTDVVADVRDFLAARREAAAAAGVDPGQVILDPGFGFGKTAEHNLALLANLSEIVALGAPVLVGFSRKSTIGKVLDLPVGERLAGSLAAAALAVAAGARIVRAHDVPETVRAVRMAEAVIAHRRGESGS